MQRESALPADFGRRVEAGRGYAKLTRKKLAERLNVDSASASSIKAWEETEHRPSSLAHKPLVQRLAQVTGLPEAFYWARSEAAAEDAAVTAEGQREQIEALRLELAARDLEVLRQLEEVLGIVQDVRGRLPG